VSLLGWSFGGIVAAEVARALLAEGYPVALVAMVDSVRPRLHPQGISEAFWNYLFEAASVRDPAERWARIRSGGTNVAKLQIRRLRSRLRPTTSLGPDDPLARAVHLAYLNYRATDFCFPVTLFVAEETERRWGEPSLGWASAFTHGWQLQRVGGGHFTLFNPEHLDRFVAALVEVLPASLPTT